MWWVVTLLGMWSALLSLRLYAVSDRVDRLEAPEADQWGR